MSHTIPTPTCLRARPNTGGSLGANTATDRLAAAASAADHIAAAVEAEVARLHLVGEDAGDLPAIARSLGALHGELDELGHWLEVAR